MGFYLAVLVSHGPAEDHPAESRFAADDNSALADFLPGRDRTAVDDVLDPHRHVVGGGENDLPDLVDPPPLLGPEVVAGSGGVGHREGRDCGVLALADQPKTTHDLYGVALNEVVAADVGMLAAMASCNCLSVML